MKNPIKIDNATGMCSLYMFECHDVVVDSSKVCEACIEAQRKDLESRAEMVIHHLESGKALTKIQCIQMFNYINLGDIVYKLRKKNTPDYILTEMKTNKVSGARYAVYKLNK